MAIQIENHSQLRAEISRLLQLKKIQEQALQEKVELLQSDLEPSQLVPDLISNVLFSNSDKSKSGLLFKAVNSGVIFLAENMLLKKSPAIIKAAVAMTVGNVTADALTKNSPAIYKNAGDLLRKFKKFVSKNDQPTINQNINGSSSEM